MTAFAPPHVRSPQDIARQPEESLVAAPEIMLHSDAPSALGGRGLTPPPVAQGAA